MTFLDSNVLLDIVQGSSIWTEWSRLQLNERGALGPLLLNDVVFAELSVSFERVAELNAFLAAAQVERERTPPQALFLAARAHLQYRRQGGTRLGVLPDFFIGAHALVASAPLLTRDAARYRAYFPELHVIAP